MAGIAFAKVVADCELMKEALDPLLEEMPYLASEHGELVSFLEHVVGLNTRQQDLLGQLRQTTRLRQEAELQGLELRGRVAALLRGKLGFKNEELLKFGVPPRRPRRARPAGEPPAEAPEEPAAPQPGAAAKPK